MITIACVLRSGGPYDRRYVQFLRDGVKEHLSEPHRFVCLTDVEGVWGIEREPLIHDWPGWWSKIELFRPGLFGGPVLYLDLDNIIVGDLSGLAAARGFCMVRDARHAWIGASPVMAWEPGESTEEIYTSFARTPEGVMDSHIGDQSWISGSHVWRDLNEICPGQLVYRWWDCLQGIPEAASVVMYHGSPKPHEVEWSASGMYPQRKYEWGKDGAMGPRRGG